MFRGFGTVVNIATIVAGSGIGVLLGHRLPQRTRDTVTDGLGLVTLLIAALTVGAVSERALTDATGADAPVLIVLGAILVGGIAGSLLRVEERLEGIGAWLRDRLSPGPPSSDVPDDAAQHRFVEGFVTASLVFCVGPLTILGSLSDGLGEGAQQLLLKAALDGFASVAFAASLGIGVMASALSVLVVQGSLTALGAALGSFVPEPHLLALTATGGLLLAGVGLRLLRIRQVPVGDLLPALPVAPLLTALVITLR